MITTRPTDNELHKRMAGGDTDAFAELYRRHQRGVYGFALQMLGAREAAEDVTQEVFVSLMRERILYDEKRGSLKSFLLGVTRNYVLRKLKQERAFVSLESTAHDLFTQVESESLVQNESISEMRQAILSLPGHYREVVVLCELQELSYAEAAEVLGCAIGTIRSRLHRARTMLTEKLNARDDCATAKGIESERCFA